VNTVGANMIDFPMFNAEARMSARRRPTFQVRAVYGALLLAFFWIFQLNHEGWLAGRPLSKKELAQFAEAAFEWLAVGQALIVLAIVPALVAGTVAEERSRRTLPGLLASRLSSAAIILDKLAARMLHVGVILTVGLPITFLLGLLGGVDPRSAVYAYGGTFSTAFFLAALSLLVSVYARGPRGAVLLVYLIEVVWLVVPWLANFATVTGAWAWLGALAPVNDWILPSTPLSLFAPATSSAWSGQGPISWLLSRVRMIPPVNLAAGGGGPGVLTVPLGQMVGLQLAYGTTFLVCAAWRLRPVARRLADGPRRRALNARIRGRSRPACGDDPMLWKERYSQDDRPARLIVWMGMLVFATFFVLRSHEAFTHNYRLALDELFMYGYGTGGPDGSGVSTRAGFMNNLADYSVMLYIVALVAVAVQSATGVTSEREARTWDGLLGTPLEPAEVVRAKVLGALVPRRALLLLVLIPWLVGLAVGALHPVGLLLAVAGLAAFLWFASALGILFSLRSSSSRQALVRTLGVLLVLNFGTLLAGKLWLGSFWTGILFGNTAVLLHFLPISPYHMNAVVLHSTWRQLLVPGLLLGIVAAYAVLAWILSRAATRGFDAAADRPRRMPSSHRSA
jgi:ABC-type transport system involved in multi-copper enzyme maturation permease subunit